MVIWGPFLAYAFASACLAAALVLTIDDPVLPSEWPEEE